MEFHYFTQYLQWKLWVLQKNRSIHSTDRRDIKYELPENASWNKLCFYTEAHRPKIILKIEHPVVKLPSNIKNITRLKYNKYEKLEGRISTSESGMWEQFSFDKAGEAR